MPSEDLKVRISSPSPHCLHHFPTLGVCATSGIYTLSLLSAVVSKYKLTFPLQCGISLYNAPAFYSQHKGLNTRVPFESHYIVSVRWLIGCLVESTDSQIHSLDRTRVNVWVGNQPEQARTNANRYSILGLLHRYEMSTKSSCTHRSILGHTPSNVSRAVTDC